MDIICIAKPGVHLWETLYASETSRHILRFYHPQDAGWGIRIPESTVSNALALLSELRWYIMRYMEDVIIEDARFGVYLTRHLAKAVYEDRSVALGEGWEHMYRAAILEDGSMLPVPVGMDTPQGTRIAYLVWCMPAEVP
ncbi:MAG TPA: DUF5804 family protein [Methanocorpusculum sp.]|nr:DUF5804 family protein [Methanocorpusculum sp.]